MGATHARARAESADHFLDRPGLEIRRCIRRKLLDGHAAQRLAEKMGINEFRVLAISGGAPYALGRPGLPEQVRAIAVVSGVPPLADLTDRSGLLALYRWLFFYPRHRECCVSHFTPRALFFRSSADSFPPLLLKLCTVWTPT